MITIFVNLYNPVLVTFEPPAFQRNICSPLLDTIAANDLTVLGKMTVVFTDTFRSSLSIIFYLFYRARNYLAEHYYRPISPIDKHYVFLKVVP